MLERTEVFELRDKYQGRKNSGYDIDEKVGALLYILWMQYIMMVYIIQWKMEDQLHLEIMFHM